MTVKICIRGYIKKIVVVTIKECDGCLKKSKKKREECSMSVVTTSIGNLYIRVF